MPLYLIERDVPGANNLTQAQLREIARKSNCAIETMGPDYIWHNSYVVGDKIICVHEARDAEAIREHSRRGGFPVSRISEIAATVSPQSADTALTRA